MGLLIRFSPPLPLQRGLAGEPRRMVTRRGTKAEGERGGCKWGREAAGLRTWLLEEPESLPAGPLRILGRETTTASEERDDCGQRRANGGAQDRCMTAREGLWGTSTRPVGSGGDHWN